MTDIVKIKDKRMYDWLEKIWPDRVFTGVDYLRDKKLVRIKFLEREYTSNFLIKDFIYYPILNSHKGPTELNPAMPPYLMKDTYEKNGYIKAGGHNLASINGLKIHMKDIGIEVNVVKDRKSRNPYATTHHISFGKLVYKIYPKTDIDYAMFIMYFSNDIGPEEKDSFISMKPVHWQVLPLSKKFGNNVLKNGKKRK